MISQLSTDADELGGYVTEALHGAGGVEILRAALVDPGARAAQIEELLAQFGVWELDPHADAGEFEACAAVARAAGSVAIPYPVCERLGGKGSAGGVLLVAHEGKNFAAHADLDLDWTAVDVLGRGYSVTKSGGQPMQSTLGSFVSEVDVVAEDHAAGGDRRSDAATLMTLQGWWLLGLLEKCVADTAQYVQEREQFGQRLAAFQAVGFGVADMSIAAQKLEELAKYTVWSQSASDTGTALVDALALRAASLEAAEVILRGTHQLHGAMGFCDETDVSLLSRASHLVRRLPLGVDQTFQLLTEAVLRQGLDGPFSDPADAL